MTTKMINSSPNELIINRLEKKINALEQNMEAEIMKIK